MIQRERIRSALPVIAAAALFAGAVLVMMGYTTQLVNALPYLLILACPLMHMFGHRHHGHHGARPEPERGASAREKGSGSPSAPEKHS